jgi:hypothetical protein
VKQENRTIAPRASFAWRAAISGMASTICQPLPEDVNGQS